VLEPLPTTLGASAAACLPAPLVDGSVTCEASVDGGARRYVMVDDQDVLVTAASPDDAALSAALRAMTRPGPTSAGTPGGAVVPPAVGGTAALEAALAPAIDRGCAALAGADPAATQAACAALGLENGGSVQGSSFVPPAAVGPTSTYLVDVLAADGTLRSAEVDVAYQWDRATRRGTWQVIALRPV
jgi:hypothetical protein